MERIRLRFTVWRVAAISLVGSVAVGVALGQAWPDRSGKPQAYESRRITRGEFGPDGDLFTLTKGAHEIVRWDPFDWTVKARYHTDETKGGRTLETLDFAVDRFSGVHALTLREAPDGSRYSALYRFQAAGLGEEIPLSRTLLAGTVRLNRAGDYYVLGLDAEVLEEALSRRDSIGSVTLFLIHKYSAEGTWSAGLFPFEAPAGRANLLEFIRSYPSLSDLEVVDSGEVFMLFERVSKDFGRDLSGVEGELYRIVDSGQATPIRLRSPVSDGLLIDLHSDGGDLFLEWYARGNRESPENETGSRYLLAAWRSEGPVQGPIRSAADVLAVSPSHIAVSSPAASSSGSNLFVVERASLRKD